MPRDICAISEDLSPGCLTTCDYDGLGRRLDGYDEGGNLFRDHAYQQPEGDKQVAIKVGRYISSDLIGLAGGLNTFGYVAQNPVSRIDRRGLDVIVLVNDNGPVIGTHAGVWVHTPGQSGSDVLYDPGGSYKWPQIGSGHFLEGADANLLYSISIGRRR